jgi:hypothetical protein
MTFTKLLLAIACVGVGVPNGLAQSKNAKIVDVRPYSVAGPSIIAPNNGHPIEIPTSSNMFSLAVALDDMIYSIDVHQSRHRKPIDFIVGDPVEAHLDGKKLVVIDASGKSIKATITRKERLPLTQQ